MEKLLPIINRLQDVFHSVGMLDTIDLPQIAVVGSQSSGKSSVLENVVGRDFLPRGVGIVTRRPLVLQLSNVPKSKDKKKEEWGEFLHIPKQKFYDFQEIKQQIVADTERVTGKNKGISQLPIHLKIFSPYVLNLTLVDLPGITKVPVGDQPKDIEYQIRKMILKFISKPNCIILAVTPANSDIANSDALKMAREVDSKGSRTLGVLTKIDLMDRGTDALDILKGKVYYLRRGFIGVINRGQQDIKSGKAIREALKDEAVYFQTHESYKNISSKLGTPYLAKTLNTILLNHIRTTLPTIKNKVQALIVQAQKRLATYGTALAESSMSQGALLLQLVTKFSTRYVNVIDGKSTELANNSLFGGARINHIFTKKFTPYLIKLDACESLTEEDIKMAITNAKGPRTSLFVPEASFDMLVKRQVKHLENPALHCVDQVLDELLTIVEYSAKDLMRFPNLKEKVKELTVDLLRSYTEPLKMFIKNLIKIELAYINTNHPDFFGGGSQAIQLIGGITNKKPKRRDEDDEIEDDDSGSKSKYSLNGKKSKSRKSKTKTNESYEQFEKTTMNREEMEMRIIRQLLNSYFGIVRKSVADSVPKSVMHFLVNKSKENIQSELVRKMYKDELFKELLKENDEIATKRKATEKMLAVLQRASQIINEVRDLRI